MTLKTKIFALLSTLWAAFIFSNSFKTGASSDKMSNPIVDKITGWFSQLGINIDVDLLTFIVRKSAHFTEFLILGVLITICFVSIGKRLSYYRGSILFLCLASGVTDEFIQSMIPKRSSEVRDILIDFTGALIGFLAISLFTKIMANQKYKNRRFR